MPLSGAIEVDSTSIEPLDYLIPYYYGAEWSHHLDAK